ncbi:MAG: hypothetical protein N2484_10435 [Clostridia bacterium]|nr:hypothetical protein [Clostridia bacterium]
MNRNKILFESFNKAINEYFERHEKENEKKAEQLAKSSSQAELANFIAQTVNQVQDVAREWENTPNPDLDQKTPKEYIEGINDFDTLMEAFKIGAKTVDVDLPYTFLEKLKSFSQRAMDALLELASDPSMLQMDSEDAAIPLAAISALGMWKTEEAVQSLIELMAKSDPNYELLFETVSNTLIEIGTPSIEPLVRKLEAAETYGIIEEYLFSTLSKAGATNKSDRVYKCLKSAFSKLENKALGALFLAEYGDGRAIPALRGYVEKNVSALNREIFYDIKYAIERLGGSMEDIKFDYRGR